MIQYPCFCGQILNVDYWKVFPTMHTTFFQRISKTSFFLPVLAPNIHFPFAFNSSVIMFMNALDVVRRSAQHTLILL